VEAIRASVTLDWTQKAAVRANMRRKVKRLLRKHGYPPDKRAEALITVIEQAEVVCRDWAEHPPAPVLPFVRLAPEAVQPFVNAVPLYDLQIAAGQFGAAQPVDESSCAWVRLRGKTAPAKGLFVAQVLGESMNRRIPNGAWCVWRLNPGCDGQSGAEVVLAQHHGVRDPETDASYSVKLYEAERVLADDGTWRNTRITLRPSSTDSRFEPLVFDDLEPGALEIVAELVEVLG
jgi:hypothetical protein